MSTILKKAIMLLRGRRNHVGVSRKVMGRVQVGAPTKSGGAQPGAERH
jgi:hypothetical protein